jgi:RimJ/RimL family protein N-acetyltransferase
VVVDANDSLVGNAFLVAIDLSQLDAWVAYRTAPWARGRGVATAATMAMTDYAFDSLGLERLSLGHAIANPASCRIATKCGFSYEGTRRAAYRDPQGIRWDDHVHGRIKEGVVVGS